VNRFICIHGHFYQPPRENAWLEEIEVQDTAAPYHDWNERVSAECYAPNTASRILDNQDRIIDIVNNYSRISFDAGPTLLTWLEKCRPDAYQAILDADRDSQKKFHGHGSAMAQAYNHLIMPLANRRDKRTQVVWGLGDFEARFGRKPEGMWLPETAVDLESLDIMAERGISFTILSPTQAGRVKDITSGTWTDIASGRVDPRSPYLCRLPSGRTISLFFYNGPIAHDVAFGSVLQNGEFLAGALIKAFSGEQTRPELVHIATDGETYGHHHRFGDMALAYCLYDLEASRRAELTVYGDYLERFPATKEVQIVENTSWSCSHGVERWRSNCGDSSGMHPRWNQEWRAPLRGAMDWLRAELIGLYEAEMRPLAPDPWDVRDDYIGVIRNRSAQNIEAFLSRHIPRTLTQPEKVKVLKLLEMQRHAMLMYTSDGWFFDDISNIETTQVIQYAARAIQLFRDIGGRDLEPEYVGRLAAAKSNIPEVGDGRRAYDMFVRPSVVDFLRLGAHYAVSSLFEEYPQAVRIANYAATAEVCERSQVGQRALAVGKVRLKSEITWEERTDSYAVVHLGDQNLIAGVREFDDETRFNSLCRDLRDAFARSDMTAVIRLIDQGFGAPSYSLWHLFRDEKRRILSRILKTTLEGLEATFRRIYESSYSIMQAMKEMQIPLPEALSVPAEFVLNADLRRAIEKEPINLGDMGRLITEFEMWSIKPDRASLGFIISRRVNALMKSFAGRPEDPASLKTIEDLFALLRPLSIELDLWQSQNIYFSIGKQTYLQAMDQSRRGDATANAWVDSFNALGAFLHVKPPELPGGSRT
jgi:alpha-amylase/alpha-mannosidase (GH57 family)